MLGRVVIIRVEQDVFLDHRNFLSKGGTRAFLLPNIPIPSKLYKHTSLTPMFHTGRVKPVGGGVDPIEFSSWSIIPFLTTRCPSWRFFFKGLRWATLGLERVQNSMITTGVLKSGPDKKIF